VGELSLPVQAKLLRVLDVQEFTRVGDTRPQKVNVRFISATNKDLEDMVEKGAFRNDLYYRLKAGMITTEPLSRHSEDVLLLIEHFLADNAARSRGKVRLSPEAKDLLAAYEWPGNVRQVKNAVDTLCMICETGRAATAGDVRTVLKIETEQAPPALPPIARAKFEFEQNYFRTMLARHEGNVSAAASAAGMDRGNFSKKAKSLGLDPADFRTT
ncbi:MAG: sigma-54-dependent Fis family transcriptional regulator, partial [Chitinivibrionales bacterium]|nr:sigma-54-dependent Fis family transcriptional regulator [Chitinivibrionales bacterium]MBD3395025.1 sigma-54-dependent Fis family transcriptional regulator [Chitinivibrionales bacterium]